MLQMAAALQTLFLFFFTASGFHQITGAGTGTSLLIGGFGGIIGLFVLYQNFPKATLGIAAVAWAVGGFMLGNYVFGTVGGTFFTGLILGGIGLAANAGLMAEMGESVRQGEALAEKVLPKIMSAKDRDGLITLWHGARLLNQIKVIDSDTYSRINAEISGMLRLQDPPANGDEEQPINAYTAMSAVEDLKINGAISEEKAVEILKRIEIWETAQNPAAKALPARAPIGLTPDGSLTKIEIEILSNYLPKLVENRALSVATFVRIKGKFDPDFDPSGLSDSVFPFEDSADQDDLETVERLHRAGLLDPTEYRRALQVILPYLHTA